MKVKKVVVEDYTSQQIIYSKNLRKFKCEFDTVESEDGKELQLVFTSNRVIDDETLLKEYIHTHTPEDGATMRVTINDQFFMLGLGKNITIEIIETNYNKEKYEIIIKINGTRTVPNDKAIKEIADYFKEDEDGRED